MRWSTRVVGGRRPAPAARARRTSGSRSTASALVMPSAISAAVAATQRALGPAGHGAAAGQHEAAAARARGGAVGQPPGLGDRRRARAGAGARVCSMAVEVLRAPRGVAARGRRGRAVHCVAEAGVGAVGEVLGLRPGGCRGRGGVGGAEALDDRAATGSCASAPAAGGTRASPRRPRARDAGSARRRRRRWSARPRPGAAWSSADVAAVGRVSRRSRNGQLAPCGRPAASGASVRGTPRPPRRRRGSASAGEGQRRGARRAGRPAGTAATKASWSPLAGSLHAGQLAARGPRRPSSSLRAIVGRAGWPSGPGRGCTVIRYYRAVTCVPQPPDRQPNRGAPWPSSPSSSTTTRCRSRPGSTSSPRPSCARRRGVGRAGGDPVADHPGGRQDRPLRRWTSWPRR